MLPHLLADRLTRDKKIDVFIWCAFIDLFTAGNKNVDAVFCIEDNVLLFFNQK